jgi:hypothetical protein
MITAECLKRVCLNTLAGVAALIAFFWRQAAIGGVSSGQLLCKVVLSLVAVHIFGPLQLRPSAGLVTTPQFDAIISMKLRAQVKMCRQTTLAPNNRSPR